MRETAARECVAVFGSTSKPGALPSNRDNSVFARHATPRSVQIRIARRQKLVAGLMRRKMGASDIARFLSVPVSTVSADMRFLRSDGRGGSE